MSDDDIIDLIEQVARALCVARGLDPDAIVREWRQPAWLIDNLYEGKLPDDSFRPLWQWKIPEARAAFVCIRDLHGIKDVL